MRISLCTTCMGRLPHLRETLPANLSANEDYPTLEIVVLDYNSQDGLEKWMALEMRHWVESGRLAYYRERTAQFFNPSHAKNVAHLLATGDVVVNVDADNFTGPGYAAKLAEMFGQGTRIFVTTDTESERERFGSLTGLAGRIAFRATDFRALRGYDEAFVGWGWEDPDIARRARGSGLNQTLLVNLGERAIRHSSEERVRNCDMRGRTRSETSSMNEGRSKSRPAGEMMNPVGYGKAFVYRNFTAERQEVGA